MVRVEGGSEVTVTDADRHQAFANIKAAARHYDVEVTAEKWQDLGKP